MRMQNTLVVIGSLLSTMVSANHQEPLDRLSASALKDRHDKALVQRDNWLERRKNALPKGHMDEQRAEAVRLAQQAASVRAGIDRDIDIRRLKIRELNNELSNLERERVKAEGEEARRKRIAEELRNRSTTEKVEEKIDHFTEEAKRIQKAFYAKSLWDRFGIELSRSL